MMYLILFHFFCCQVLASQDFEMDGAHDEEAAVTVTVDDPEEDVSTSSKKRASSRSMLWYEDSSRHLAGRSIRLTPQTTAPNCCAICLNHYRAGETVVWSVNPSCRHAFHSDCMLDWLVKIPVGKPGLCPCCRQEFIVAAGS